MQGAQPGEQQTVKLRVQVVDMTSFTLDLVVPTYLPARDLTQRIARDAGLAAQWEDGRRRLYWLRARGRRLGDDDELRHLGVVSGELVYLLPEPPPGSAVLEQKPDYPQTRGYSGKGLFALLGSILVVCSWSVGWGLALSVERSLAVVLLPGLALGFLTTSLARHAWGGRGGRLRVAATGILLFFFIALLAFTAPLFYADGGIGRVVLEVLPGIIAGLVGVLVGWLAWWGAVEPLPEVKEQAEIQEAEAQATVPCAVCGGQVTPDVRQECPHGCGRFFHVGCFQARVSVYRGDERICAICNQAVGT